MVEDVFGEKLSGQTYVDREGVYAIILNNKNEVATIQLQQGYFLPGGGIEGNESKESCLRRECLEELGWEIEINQLVCHASNYHYSIYRQAYLHSIGHFYLASYIEKVSQPIEKDHKLVWMKLEDCFSQLHLDHQAWAIEKATQLL
ncbi:MAG: NUDIX domain-containing protein [Turicibacter sp.]|nr:NUDIX domain-containing protein [Turicibacter sp.]